MIAPWLRRAFAPIAAASLLAGCGGNPGGPAIPPNAPRADGSPLAPVLHGKPGVKRSGSGVRTKVQQAPPPLPPTKG